MTNKNLDFITQLYQFRKEHALHKNESFSSITNRLCCSSNVLVEAAIAPKVQQDITKFESFDPKFIMKSMQTAHKVMRDKVEAGECELISIPVVRTVGTTKRIALFTNNIAFSGDIECLCSLFVTGRVKKIINYSSQIQRILQVLIEKYGILTIPRKPGYPPPPPLRADIITIPRIAAAFPAVTVEVFHQGLGKVLVQPSQIIGRDVAWPRAFLCRMMASMVPEIINKPIAQLLAVTVANDEVLHQSHRKTKLIRLLRNLKASLQSTVVPNDVKLSRCRKWGLMVEEVEEFIPAIKDTAMDCKEYIRAQRPDDPGLESVLRELSEVDGGVPTRPSPEPAVNGHV